MKSKVATLSFEKFGFSLNAKTAKISYYTFKYFINFMFNAVLRPPLTKVKLPYSLLKLIFGRKCIKLSDAGLLKWNMSNDVFLFSVIIIELEFQPVGFLALHLYHFYPKSDSNAHFNPVFSNIGWFKAILKRVFYLSHRLKNVWVPYGVIFWRKCSKFSGIAIQSMRKRILFLIFV